jgi:putative endonuclease
VTLPRRPLASKRLKGRLGETVALTAYLLRGWRPAPRPLRALAQTDLLLLRGRTLALVEVKYRPRETTGHLALHPAQAARLHNQARALLAHYPSYTLRLDLCLVFSHWPFVRRLENIGG